jgi:transaldolase / glucose-6-phosphate isomerase
LRTLADFEKLGQAVWYDYLRRSFIASGELERLINEGLRGVTSNPTIFEKAVEGSSDYDQDLKRLAQEQTPVREMYETLVLEDIAKTADLFRPVFERLHGIDGFVSIEVDPRLANDSKGMIDEARRFYKALNRPNVMIKIPATKAGFPAIKTLIGEGINVNVTLIFSLKQYKAAAESYISGLEEFAKTHEDLSAVSSVASFFVSRVDTKVDDLLAKRGNKRLQGKIAIANAKLAYAQFKRIFRGARWSGLKARGARAQRVLWASTSAKNPKYPDTLYVDNLIGPNTINTMPPETLRAALDHGALEPDSISTKLTTARSAMKSLEQQGINFDSMAEDLENEGVAKFVKSIESLFQKIGQKRDEILIQPEKEEPSFGTYQSEVESALNELSIENIVPRIWKQDYTIWKSDPKEITNRLGWLTISERMEESLHPLEELVDSIKTAGYTHCVLLGMGGSSLAPRTFVRVFGVEKNFLSLSVLDSTEPATIGSIERGLEYKDTLFVVSSKSGKTIETLSLFRYFYHRTIETLGREKAGEHFIAITDAETELEKIADASHFRSKFLNDPDIGGRYSALSYFGLVPASLIGVDLRRLLDNALTMASACEACVDIRDNPGMWLGAALGQLAKSGRNKLTLASSPIYESLGLWIEQLIAESTGKDRKGILPVVDEKLGPPEVYGDDRMFVCLSDRDDASLDDSLTNLKEAGQPVLRLSIRDKYEIGKQFFQWEFGTAIAGRILGINPFDQPDVESAKEHARRIVASFVEKGTFPPEAPSLVGHGISVFGETASANPAEAVANFIKQRVRKDSYVAIQAYLEETPETQNAFDSIRLALRRRFKVATTLGYGPRYLHSTGQLHKGDSGKGVFLQFTCDEPYNPDVPDNLESKKSSISFGALTMAEALGDRGALQEKGRPILRLHLGREMGPKLEYFVNSLPEVLLQNQDENYPKTS